MPIRIPSAGTPLAFRDLYAAFCGLRQPLAKEFQHMLRTRLGVCGISLVNSGTNACFILLKALAAQNPGRREVVLPAYTAPSLTLPIRKAGLVPRLCEISLETFNMDPHALAKTVSPETLCVMPVHMFGLPCDMDVVRRATGNPPPFVVEDAASSLGAKFKNKETGAWGDVGVFSFNRGKNLSTLAGGCVVTDHPALFERIEAERCSLPELSRSAQRRLLLKLAGLAAAVRPVGYTALYPIVRRYKYTTLHTDFESYQYPDVLAGAGISLLARAEELFEMRYRNGLFLLEALENLPGVRLPRILPKTRPVFNQFPVLVEHPEARNTLIDEIARQTGVEATTLYPDPLHHIYDMGYPPDPDPFPHATVMSRQLLLIPCHPLMTEKILTRIVAVFRRIAGR